MVSIRKENSECSNQPKLPPTLYYQRNCLLLKPLHQSLTLSLSTIVLILPLVIAH